MTREIKFRAWDKENKKWATFYLSDWGSWTGASMCQLNHKDRPDEFEMTNDSRWEWSQFTGLKDKNGKEIYFGDILKYTDHDASLNENTFVGPVVETMNGGAGIEIDNTISDLWEDEDVHTFEIVGNIYENLDLLK